MEYPSIIKRFTNFSVATIIIVAFGFILSFFGLTMAAVTPSLGAATSFGILSETFVNTISGTIINGDLGYTIAPAMDPTVNGITYIGGGSGNTTYVAAGSGQAAALIALNNE